MRPAQWVNTATDEAALHVLLGRVAQRLPVETIDEVWILPTRRNGGVESTVIVFASFDDEPDRRRVSTAHFTATRDRKGNATVQEKMEQHAIAPLAAVARVVDGVLRRAGEELAIPHAERIAGDPARWQALLETFGSPPPPAESGG
jgi:hypothetical protein